MAFAAEDDQVVKPIAATPAAMLLMMDLELVSSAARLAAPSVTLEHAVTEFVVVIGWQAPGPLLGQGSAHAVSFISPKKTFCSGAGKH